MENSNKNWKSGKIGNYRLKFKDKKSKVGDHDKGQESKIKNWSLEIKDQRFVGSHRLGVRGKKSEVKYERSQFRDEILKFRSQK